MKLHHQNVFIGKHVLCIGFSVICGFRHLLRNLGMYPPWVRGWRRSSRYFHVSVTCLAQREHLGSFECTRLSPSGSCRCHLGWIFTPVFPQIASLIVQVTTVIREPGALCRRELGKFSNLTLLLFFFECRIKIEILLWCQSSDGAQTPSTERSIVTPLCYLHLLLAWNLLFLEVT